MFESKRNSNRQKKFPSRQKKLPSRQKKYPYGLEDFVRVFGKLTTPYVMFESKKKTQILIEFLDGTKKVQLAAKKSFLVGGVMRPTRDGPSLPSSAYRHPANI